MAQIQMDEITPGLNVFLDTSALVECDGVLTNVRVIDGQNRAVNKMRPFLVLEVDEVGACLCVPIFYEPAGDRVDLEQCLKSGPGRGWRERTGPHHTSFGSSRNLA